MDRRFVWGSARWTLALIVGLALLPTDAALADDASTEAENYVLSFAAANFTATQGASLPVGGGGPHEGWFQGLTADLDGATVAGHRLEFRLAPVPAAPDVGAGSLFLERAELLPGAEGPQPDRIRIDTRASTIPSLAFRGLLEPSAAVMHRQAIDAAAGLLRFAVSLPDLHEFAGRVRRRDGSWVPVRGWAERADLTVVMDWDGDRASNPRLAGMVLREGDDGTTPRPALLHIDDPEFRWSGTADAFDFIFGDSGDLVRVVPRGVFSNDIERKKKK